MYFSSCTYFLLKAQIANTNQYEDMEFPLTDGKPLQEVNHKDHLKKEIYDKKNRAIAFFDDLLPKGDLDALRLYLLHYTGAYAYQGYDESSDTEHDNVSWIAAIKVKISFIRDLSWPIYYRPVCSVWNSTLIIVQYSTIIIVLVNPGAFDLMPCSKSGYLTLKL
jgi:hypothetical protein